MTLDLTNFIVSWMKKTVIVDVIVNSVIRLKGRERGEMGVRIKGWGSCY